MGVFLSRLTLAFLGREERSQVDPPPFLLTLSLLTDEFLGAGLSWESSRLGITWCAWQAVLAQPGRAHQPRLARLSLSLPLGHPAADTLEKSPPAGGTCQLLSGGGVKGRQLSQSSRHGGVMATLS